MELDGHALAAMAGLFGGVLLGLAARRGRFCTLGAIEDALYADNRDRLRMWALALAAAIVGTHALAALGWVDLSATLYAQTAWNPVAGILGGLLFGYGMALAGNCGFGALARLGGGDLRSFVIVVVMGIMAYATISGPLAGARIALFPPEVATGPTTYAGLLQGALGIPPLVTALAVAAALAIWALRAPTFRRLSAPLVWSLAVAVAILSGWAATTWIAATSFEPVPVQSHSFTRPLGETVLYAMTSSGAALSFAIGSVVGVIGGAVLGSLSKGHFRWEACDDPHELGRQILGGALMGVGGVLALGCSVGQGLTAFSMLAVSAPIVLAAIAAGAALGLRHLIQGWRVV